MQRCITVPNRPCFLTTRERSETGVMNPNSHSSCTSLSQNVTRSLESNFQIGSHITIGQETFRGGSGRGTRSKGWHHAQFPGVPALKEPARAASRGRTEGTCWQHGEPGEEEERKGGKPSQMHGRAGQEASLLSAPLGFICNDGLCWQPVGCAVEDPRRDNPSASHSGNPEDIFRHLQLHPSVSLP